jgi:hypothetical protein
MARILPERTVEAWSTAYVRWFPTALLWAPTQADPLNWDAAVGLLGWRCFVLEYKAVEGGASGKPYITIETAQLKAYVADNKRVGADAVLYLLPYWTEVVASDVTMPAEAKLRTLRAGHPNGQPPEPAYPQALPPTRTEYALGRGCESFFFLATPEALLAAVNANAANATLRVARVPAVAEGVTLEHFVHAVSAGHAGVTWRQLHEAAARPTDQPRRRGAAARMTMAFAVPGTAGAAS